MFFKTRNRKRGEDLNRKVEKYRRWWQDQPSESSLDGSEPSEKGKPKQRPLDSSFVYHEEG
jgi:hypothetical protein